MLSRDHLIQLVVLAVLAANLAAFAWMSEQRYFDYDEFQVLYASNSMLQGKALYADQVGTHFPLTNFLIATVIEATGATVSSVVVARRLVLVFSFLTLFMVYKTGSALGNREVGLVAAALTATCSVFFDKALEIRHDVFSTGFLVGAIYLFVRFHTSRKLLWLCLSGVCAGLALAATQKAIVSLTGIGLGIAVVSFSSQGRKEAINAVVTFAGLAGLSLFLVLCVLVVIGNETPASILENTVLNRAGYLAPGAADAELAFSESRLSMWSRLLSKSPLLYPLAIAALLVFLIRDFGSYRAQHVVVFWGAVGVAFYLYMKRPFFQSLLPTVPALALSVALLLDECKRFRIGSRAVGLVAYCVVLLALLGWPSAGVAKLVQRTDRASRNPVQPFTRSLSNQNELASLKFCVDHARPGEKVICFTQQQIFFDPLLSYRENACGRSVRSVDRDCLLEKIRQSQSRILIYDYRTRALPQKTQTALLESFQRTGIGDIYIPGFVLEPGEAVEKQILISGPYRIGVEVANFGTYRAAPESLELDGTLVPQAEVQLVEGVHRFENRTSQRVRVLYEFR
jgi:hypothetical protein